MKVEDLRSGAWYSYTPYKAVYYCLAVNEFRKTAHFARVVQRRKDRLVEMVVSEIGERTIEKRMAISQTPELPTEYQVFFGFLRNSPPLGSAIAPKKPPPIPEILNIGSHPPERM